MSWNRKRQAFVLIVLIILGLAFSTAQAAVQPMGNLATAVELKPGETGSYPLAIENMDTQSHSYQLLATGDTNRYEFYFTSGGQPVTSIQVEPGQIGRIALSIHLIANGANASDAITAEVKRDDGQVLVSQFAVLFDQSRQLSLKALQTQLDATSGQTLTVPVTVANTGTVNLTDIQIAGDLPDKWLLLQSDQSHMDLKAGERQTVEVRIEVPASQSSGSVQFQLKAVSADVESDPASVSATVHSNTNIFWWLGGGLLLAVGLNFLHIRKRGRR